MSGERSARRRGGSVGVLLATAGLLGATAAADAVRPSDPPGDQAGVQPNAQPAASAPSGPTAAKPAAPVQDKKVAPDVGFESNILYATRAEAGGPVELMMNVAWPKEGGPNGEGQKGKGPARACVIVIHGGGWQVGAREQLDPLVKDFAAHGFVSATISYRFAPAHEFPAQLRDAADAVRFLRENAARFNLDPERIGAMGFSAGGHLAMLLGCAMDEDEPAAGTGAEKKEAAAGKTRGNVRAVVSFFGPSKLDAELSGQSKQIVRELVGAEATGLEERLWAASPLKYVNKGDAPMLLFQGAADPIVPREQATLMIEAMSAAGIAGRMEMISGAGHGFGGAEFERTLRVAREFFEQELGTGH